MEPQEEHNEAEKGKRNMEKLFDLQVFAQENTQTTGGLSAEMKTYYGMELLDNAKPQLVHNQFAATKPLPTGGGKTVEWRKFGSFDKALTPLTEGVTPDGSGISVSYITKELAQYGDYTTVSDMLDLTAIDDVVLEITDRHGANMGLTLDTVTRNEIQQGKQVLYVEAQIHYANGEMERYNNACAAWNNALLTYRDFWCRSHMPRQGVKALRLM